MIYRKKIVKVSVFSIRLHALCTDIIGGGINKCLGGWCKHVRRANLHLKTLKNRTNTLSQGGIVSQTGGVCTPLGGGV